ncbi:MAG: hypothetical protein LIR50_12010 [Bacillota bacterium]|nr:hypothetical protein [Bacillota bacterium]
MRFFRFKRTTLKYFSKHMHMKKRDLRKLFKFNRFFVSADHPEENVYTASYAFMESKYQLQYEPAYGWTFLRQSPYTHTKIYSKHQPTIEKCCDFIWED